tara:strand:- start:73 stop:249 length:177 start_codon:yes stop_codon:yes gene_type:complete
MRVPNNLIRWVDLLVGFAVKFDKRAFEQHVGAVVAFVQFGGRGIVSTIGLFGAGMDFS